MVSATKNDPAKTICATSFIIAVVQNIKIGDLSSTQSGLSFSSDAPGESMDVDGVTHLPDGIELDTSPTLSRAEERILVRESTAGFAGTYHLVSQSVYLAVSQIGLPLSCAAFCLCTRIFPRKEARRTQLGESRKKVWLNRSKACWTSSAFISRTHFLISFSSLCTTMLQRMQGRMR
jgi:hypothetical protein